MPQSLFADRVAQGLCGLCGTDIHHDRRKALCATCEALPLSENPGPRARDAETTEDILKATRHYLLRRRCQLERADADLDDCQPRDDFWRKKIAEIDGLLNRTEANLNLVSTVFHPAYGKFARKVRAL